MICKHCGTEYDDTPTEHTRPEFGVHTPWACRDVLSAQLATMTKRAEDAERCIANLRIVEMMKGTIRALGIDPSKEQEK